MGVSNWRAEIFYKSEIWGENNGKNRTFCQTWMALEKKIKGNCQNDDTKIIQT